jgi:tetratricopeptide (TPR) repeat protein
MGASSIFETGDEMSTTQYLVTGSDHPILLQASFTIDPYVQLFSPYRREFLDRLRNARGSKGGQMIESQGSEDKEPFLSLQQFARGRTWQEKAYCGEKNYDVAADAYQKAIASGITNKVRLAEAHHRLGLSWEAKGQFDKAKTEMLQSLAIRPNIPEVLNNLGTVHVKLGEKSAALGVFERAVTLRPNYAVARYNLAEAYEQTNPKRALAEYETFLALVEGILEEEARVAHVNERIKALKR